MSLRNAFRHLAFRVYLTPAPRTQSESNAILAVLRDFGPIATFHVPKSGLPSPTDETQNTAPDGCVASLVFTQHTNSIAELRIGTKTKQHFEVIANTDVVDPNIEDPYNVRGLKYRKPRLASRTIQCRIVPAVETDQDDEVGDYEEKSRLAPVAAALAQNGYSSAFAVDRSSIFAEILADTDCPSGLIQGLLPKLRDEHRVPAWDDQPSGTSDGPDDDKSHEIRNPARQLDLQGLKAQRANRRTEFVKRKLDLDLSHDDASSLPSTTMTRENNVNHDSTKPVEFHDEFVSLRKFSLMGMYRQAVSEKEKRRKERRRDMTNDDMSIR